MKITQVKLGRISTPLRVPFKTALRTVSSVEDVIVELHTDTGAVGYGEAPPTGVITGDTTGAIIGAIRDHIAPAILGHEGTLSGHRSRPDGLRLRPAPHRPRYRGHPRGHRGPDRAVPQEHSGHPCPAGHDTGRCSEDHGLPCRHE